MIDKEQIAIMMKDIERYLSDLSEMEVKNNKQSYYAVSMIVFAVMNRAIDIGNEIISGSAKIPIPGTYKETFEILSQNDIITEDIEKQMVSLMKYRNIIAHEYYVLSNQEISKLKKDVYSVENYVEQIKEYLRK